MCGIVAIHSYGPGAPDVSSEELVAIRERMRARGPDGAGTWISDDRRTGLGHRRLAIIGLGAQGAQPMQLGQGCQGRVAELAISFNGEIYNHAELRDQLKAKGHRFKGSCDTEVLLHLYEEEGDAFVERLRGMFAFALWDGARRRLVLARDPLGIKPLYYADQGGVIRVASQVKALLAGEVSAQVSDAAVAGFLLFGSVPEPLTFADAVSAVPAGSVITVNERGVGEPRRFFSLTAALAGDDDAAPTAAEVRAALMDSVGSHLVSDVEVGVFLSAGIDSGTLLALASEQTKSTASVTLGFAEFAGTPNDESVLARTLASHYDSRHSVHYVSRAEFLKAMPRIFSDMDQPTIDGVNSWLVSRAASEAGLKVMLGGVGGDELFGGYANFDVIPRWARALRWPARVPGLGRAVRRFARANLRGRIPPKAAGAIEYGGSLSSVWFLRRGLFMPWELPELLGRERAENALSVLDPLASIVAALEPDPRTETGRVAALEASLYLRNQLLRDADWASMAHSLELRVPLVDAWLFEQLGPKLARHRYSPDPKRFLAESPARSLPDAVRSRAKTGFSVPVDDWLRESEGFDSWKRVPSLRAESCPWARRWAVVVADAFSLGLVQ